MKMLLLFTEYTVNVKHEGCVLCCSCEERTYSTIAIVF
jgi:NAD-dependent dihydropyrimidine dehydrogenase PreA subunit